jgi:hypothetical protein
MKLEASFDEKKLTVKRMPVHIGPLPADRRRGFKIRQPEIGQPEVYLRA